MKVKIQAGNSFESTTPAEMRGLLQNGQQAWFEEMARGMKLIMPRCPGTVAAGAVDIVGGGGGDTLAPSQGMAWRVNRLNITGLGTSDTVTVWRAPAAGLNQVDVISAARPTIYPKSGLILQSGQGLEITGTGLTATSLTVNLEVCEVPEFMIWKLF